ncbi:MAG: hypothetical protein CFE21_15595 [Bacteroidetes bacterium B1(2017)]|nr:MAG: hypothetical protein CFE21_15595 [Bacteroidetes bacterium B1(2017)]
MIIAPLISGKAFLEYANVTYFDKKPSYPFGKELMKTLQVKDFSYLANYQHELLTIGMVFLAVTVLAYISMMIKALVNLVWLAVVISVGYYIYHFVN